MKRFCIFASVVLFAAISCQKEVVEEANYYYNIYPYPLF